jgi:HTH-type transcriptional regulator, competence development regulator
MARTKELEHNRGGASREWLEKMDALEEGCEISVGGLASELGFLRPPVLGGNIAFGKLIELVRRDKGKSVEKLAIEADVELEELLLIERGEAAPEMGRTVFQLAEVLKLDAGKLMELAGVAEPRDEELKEAAVLFAARSEPMEKLTKAEKQALEAFVKVLAEKSGDDDKAAERERSGS